MSYQKLKNIIIESIKYSKSMGDIKIYRMALEYLGNDADNFMVSEYGGYEVNELNRIKKRVDYQDNRIR